MYWLFIIIIVIIIVIVMIVIVSDASPDRLQCGSVGE